MEAPIQNQAFDIDAFYTYLEKAGLDTKPHQVEGVQWCLRNEVEGHLVGNGEHAVNVRGGLVADEMGLGKTMQMIGVMLCNMKMRTLIVLPRALLEQWAHVFLETTKHKVLVYHGVHKKGVTLEMLNAAPIVITTYGMVAQRKKGLSLLHQVKWKRVVFDEAHHMRNSRTNTYQGVMKLKARIRWLITGTPIQNKCEDFYNLCDVLGLPKSYYLEPTNKGDILERFILKRTKQEVGIELPPLECDNVMVDWFDRSEKNLSECVHSLLPFSGVCLATCAGACDGASDGHGASDGADTSSEITSNLSLVNGMCDSGKQHLVAMLRARQMCVFPQLLRGKIKELVDVGTFEECPDLYRGTRKASKLDSVVSKVLERKDNGKCKLIFCHFRGEIDELKSRLMSGGVRHVETFDGRTLTGERNRIIQGRCDVLILQIQTGCEGLNLQHFSEIYFVAPHWNPSVEDQAVARCHRIGQQQPVHVFRFIMDGFAADAVDGVDGADGDADTGGIDHNESIDSYVNFVQESKRKLRKILEPDTDADADHEEGVHAGGETGDGCVDCPVCMETIVERATLSCGHDFCSGCIAEIRGRRNMLQACPICRTAI